MKYTASQWKALIKRIRMAGQKRVWIEECEPLSESPQIRLLFTWGIFNPIGPTICSLALVRPEDRSPWILYYRMSHSICRMDVACGLVNRLSDAVEIARLCRPIFAEGSPMGGILQLCPPTFVLQPARKLIGSRVVASFFETSVRNGECPDLAASIKAFRQYWLRPWEREQASLEQCISATFQHWAAAGGSAPAPVPGFTPREFRLWWKIVTCPQHINAELEAIIEAWSGSGAFIPIPLTLVTSIAEVLDFHVNPLLPALNRGQRRPD